MQTFTRIPISITFIRSITLTAVCTLGLSLSVHAQNQALLKKSRMDSAISNHKILYFGKGDEPDNDSTSVMIQNSMKTSSDISRILLLLTFYFCQKDSKLAMGIGGCVRMRGISTGAELFLHQVLLHI